MLLHAKADNMLRADHLAITAARLLLPTKRRVPLADLRWQAELVIEARRREHPELERQPQPAQLAVWQSWADDLARTVAERAAAM